MRQLDLAAIIGRAQLEGFVAGAGTMGLVYCLIQVIKWIASDV